MPHQRLIPLVGFVAALLLPLHVNGSILRDMTLAEMVRDADDIVVCTVLSVASQWDKGHRTISTSVRLKVSENWKGSPPKDGVLTLVQAGGSVGDLEMSVQGMPEFTSGERSVLFLHGGARRFVVGMSLGKRPLRFDAATKQWMVGPASRKGILRRQNARGQDTSTSESEEAMSLPELRSRVKRLLGN